MMMFGVDQIFCGFGLSKSCLSIANFLVSGMLYGHEPRK
jgi:hypothetical protein